MGLSTTGDMVEILADGTDGSWTIVMTLPNGLSCLVAAGENWEFVEPKDNIKYTPVMFKTGN